MTDVDAYIANLDPSIRKLAEKVRSVTTRALPSALESLKMGIPTYSINGISIAAIADYTHHINLYFFSGAKLSSTLLEGTGKRIRHIKIQDTRDVKKAEFARLLNEAAKFTRTARTPS
jgi:hypothetical protein